MLLPVPLICRSSPIVDSSRFLKQVERSTEVVLQRRQHVRAGGDAVAKSAGRRSPTIGRDCIRCPLALAMVRNDSRQIHDSWLSVGLTCDLSSVRSITGGCLLRHSPHRSLGRVHVRLANGSVLKGQNLVWVLVNSPPTPSAIQARNQTPCMTQLGRFGGLCLDNPFQQRMTDWASASRSIK